MQCRAGDDVLANRFLKVLRRNDRASTSINICNGQPLNAPEVIGVSGV